MEAQLEVAIPIFLPASTMVSILIIVEAQLEAYLLFTIRIKNTNVSILIIVEAQLEDFILPPTNNIF